jgi:hypothetical protein
MPKLVTIANFDEPLKAHLAKLRLKSEGIKSFLTGENFVATYWLLANAENGVKLQVKTEDAKKATQILNSQKPQNNPTIRQQLCEPELTCPHCGSNDVQYIRFSRSVFFLSILFFKFPLPWWSNIYKCTTCSCKWKCHSPPKMSFPRRRESSG